MLARQSHAVPGSRCGAVQHDHRRLGTRGCSCESSRRQCRSRWCCRQSWFTSCQVHLAVSQREPDRSASSSSQSCGAVEPEPPPALPLASCTSRQNPGHVSRYLVLEQVSPLLHFLFASPFVVYLIHHLFRHIDSLAERVSVHVIEQPMSH